MVESILAYVCHRVGNCQSARHAAAIVESVCTYIEQAIRKRQGVCGIGAVIKGIIWNVGHIVANG